MVTIEFKYKNYKGVISDRLVEFVSIDYIPYLNPEFGHQPGWFLTGRDLAKNQIRSFAVVDIIVPEDLLAAGKIFKIQVQSA